MAATGALIMTSGFLVMATAWAGSADQGKSHGNSQAKPDNKGKNNKPDPDKGPNAGNNGGGNNGGGNGNANNGNGNNGNGAGGRVHKVFVCKYVGTPGVDERLQTGNNPISVDTHALEKEGFTAQYPDTNQFPFAFEDAQGQSKAIAWDDEQGDGQNNEPDVTINDCPTPQGPGQVRPQVSSADPCGTINDTYSVTADPTRFTYTPSGSVASGTVTITFIAVQGWTIVGPNPVTLSFTDKPCPGGPNLVSPSVAFDEPTCERPNGARIRLGNRDKVDYAVAGAAGPGEGVTVQATPKAGFEFAPGTETMFSHKFKTIKSLDCPTDEPTVGGTETTRPRPDHKPKPKPDNERPPAVLGTQAGVPSAVAAGLPGTPSSGGGSGAILIAQLMVGAGLVLLIAGGWTGMGARRSRSGAHQV